MPPKVAVSKPQKATRTKIPSKRKKPSKPHTHIPELPWEFASAQQEDKYDALGGRTIIPTKYLDSHALRELGLLNRVNEILERFEWTQFMSLSHPTYREITLEFLSSFSFQHNQYVKTDEGEVTFRVMGMEHVMDLRKINEIFNTRHHGEKGFPDEFNQHQAWRNISGNLGFTSGLAKASQIIDPALKYIHRVMTHSIFGRGESTGAVTKADLYLLWSMKHGHQVNTAYWICTHLANVAKGKSGKICVGGLITAIAESVGFVHNPKVTNQVKGGNKIDLDIMVHMKLCKKVHGEYYLLDSEGNTLQGDEAMDDLERQQEASEAEEEEDQEHPEDDEGASSSHQVTMQMLLTEMREMRAQYTEMHADITNQLGGLREDMRQNRAWVEERLNELGRNRD